MLQNMTIEKALNFNLPKKIYIVILIYSWYRGWGMNMNNEQIQMGDIEIMTYAYGSSGSFG